MHASRLMELARPSGIVFDDSFQINILEDETKELFEEKTGYIRGVAEEEPIKIHFTKRHTLIPNSFKQPLKEPKLHTDSVEYPFETLKKVVENKINLELKLSRKPLDENKIRITVSHKNPKIEGFSVYYYKSIENDEISYDRIGNRSFLSWDVASLSEEMEKTEVTKDLKIKIDVVYPVE